MFLLPIAAAVVNLSYNMKSKLQEHTSFFRQTSERFKFD